MRVVCVQFSNKYTCAQEYMLETSLIKKGAQPEILRSHLQTDLFACDLRKRSFKVCFVILITFIQLLFLYKYMPD